MAGAEIHVVTLIHRDLIFEAAAAAQLVAVCIQRHGEEQHTRLLHIGNQGQLGLGRAPNGVEAIDAARGLQTQGVLLLHVPLVGIRTVKGVGKVHILAQDSLGQDRLLHVQRRHLAGHDSAVCQGRLTEIGGSVVFLGGFHGQGGAVLTHQHTGDFLHFAHAAGKHTLGLHLEPLILLRTVHLIGEGGVLAGHGAVSVHRLVQHDVDHALLSGQANKPRAIGAVGSAGLHGIVDGLLTALAADHCLRTMENMGIMTVHIQHERQVVVLEQSSHEATGFLSTHVAESLIQAICRQDKAGGLRSAERAARHDSGHGCGRNSRRRRCRGGRCCRGNGRCRGQCAQIQAQQVAADVAGILAVLHRVPDVVILLQLAGSHHQGRTGLLDGGHTLAGSGGLLTHIDSVGIGPCRNAARRDRRHLAALADLDAGTLHQLIQVDKTVEFLFAHLDDVGHDRIIVAEDHIGHIIADIGHDAQQLLAIHLQQGNIARQGVVGTADTLHRTQPAHAGDKGVMGILTGELLLRQASLGSHPADELGRPCLAGLLVASKGGVDGHAVVILGIAALAFRNGHQVFTPVAGLAGSLRQGSPVLLAQDFQHFLVGFIHALQRAFLLGLLAVFPILSGVAGQELAPIPVRFRIGSTLAQHNRQHQQHCNQSALHRLAPSLLSLRGGVIPRLHFVHLGDNGLGRLRPTQRLQGVRTIVIALYRLRQHADVHLRQLVLIAHLRRKGHRGEQRLRLFTGVEDAVIIILAVHLDPLGGVNVQGHMLIRQLTAVTSRDRAHQRDLAEEGHRAFVADGDRLIRDHAGINAADALLRPGLAVGGGLHQIHIQDTGGDHVVGSLLRNEVGHRPRGEDGQHDHKHSGAQHPLLQLRAHISQHLHRIAPPGALPRLTHIINTA